MTASFLRRFLALFLAGLVGIATLPLIQPTLLLGASIKGANLPVARPRPAGIL